MDKIEKFFNKELNNSVNKDVLIIKGDDGTYQLFGKYFISINARGHYQITTFSGDRPLIFSSLKNAVTWCVFDNNKKFNDIRRIEELDMQMSSIDVAMGMLKKRLSRSTNLDDKFIYLAKLHEIKLKRQHMQKQINSYVETSKYWQSKKFAESRSK